jgi:hypothetical protein
MKTLVMAAVAVGTLAPSAHAKGCHEISHVVGYEHCSRFGMWSRDQDIPSLRIEWGWVEHRFEARPFQLPTEPLVRTSADGSLETVANGFAHRILYGAPLIYGGIELQAAGLSTQPAVPGLPASGVSVAALGVVGAHASLGRFASAVELAGGARYTGYDYCATKDCPLYTDQGAAELEARARFDVFLGQHWSFTFAYAHSLIDRNDSSIFVFTGIHIRPMDGMY